MEYRILGPLEVRQQGQALALGGTKQRALLAILLIQANKVLAVDRLAELLWGDDPPATAAHAIEVYVSQLRRTLEPNGAPYRMLLTNPAGYSLRIDPAELDAIQFQSLVARAEQLSPEKALAQLDRALALWRGAALADFAAEHFALSEAARLNELRVHATEERIDAALALGSHATLIGELVSLTSEHPLRERLCGQLMLALYRSGRQAEASDVYQRTRERLVEEQGMEPGPELQALLRRILRQDPGLAPDRPASRLPALQIERTNLPAQLTSFIGREQELSEIADAVAKVRLVTLIGVGGSGKTRLAVQLGAALLERFADGAWFIDLTPLTDPAILPQAIAGPLGIREHQGGSLLTTVAVHLRKMSILLLIDNCEHMVDAVAGLTEALLASCPGLHVLATSRERLRIAGEHVYQVPPLRVPPPGASISPSELAGFEGVQLFVDRARQSRPTFAINDQNAEAVADLCRRLDGIPLAIELAAAQVIAFNAKEIVRHLGDRFAVLATGSRTRPPRQRTLWATLEWSHQLLDELEKTVFRRLSVFSGDFDLEAAKALGADEVITPAAIPAIVARLMDKSLVVAEPESKGETRYRLLETVREFSLELLRESGESDLLRDRHAAYYLELAQRMDQNSRHSDIVQWLPQFAREAGNFRAALETQRAGPNKGLQMATALAGYWEASGSLTEGRFWLEAMMSSAVKDKQLLARAEYRTGLLAYFQGDYDAAWAHMSAGVELKRKLSDNAGLARQLGTLAEIAMARGDGTAALRLAEEAQALSQTFGDARSRAWSDVHLGLIHLYRRDYAQAAAFLNDSLSPLQSARDYIGFAYALSGLAAMHVENGDTAAARERVVELVELVDRHMVWIEDPGWLWICLLLAEAEKRYETALRLWGAIGRLEREGKFWHPTYSKKYRHVVERATQHIKPDEVDGLAAYGAGMSREELFAEALGGTDAVPRLTL